MKLEKILEQAENRKLELKITADFVRLRMITTDCDRLRTITDNYGRLTLEEKDILLYLLDNGKISRKKATEILNIQKTKAHEILSSLVEKNLIQRQGKGKSTYYILRRMKDEM